MSLDLSKPLQPQLLAGDGPVCLVITAQLVPVGETDRFQPAGFPEIGHVIYDAPRTDADGRKYKEKVCIVDSPASMANHLEKVCLAGEGTIDLHPDLQGLPFVCCVTDRKHTIEADKILLNPEDPKDSPIVSSLTEGHRIASDYFVHSKDKPKVKGGAFDGRVFREVLQEQFGLDVIKPGSTYFIRPQTWWNIYKTIFDLDPNSLVHGILFAKEQIKISRLLTAHLEAFGASRVGSSGVKFDPLKKSLQPIFSVDEETAEEIRATFILDLALLRSYGRGENGLSDTQKRLLLDLALWKVAQLVKRPFRYRTQCFLQCQSVQLTTEADDVGSGAAESLFDSLKITESIKECKFSTSRTDVYYPANELFKPGKETDAVTDTDSNDEDNDEESA